jgi:hypothetical protein
MLRDAVVDLLAFTGFPPAHWKKIWPTNPAWAAHRGRQTPYRRRWGIRRCRRPAVAGQRRARRRLPTNGKPATAAIGSKPIVAQLATPTAYRSDVHVVPAEEVLG